CLHARGGSSQTSFVSSFWSLVRISAAQGRSTWMAIEADLGAAQHEIALMDRAQPRGDLLGGGVGRGNAAHQRAPAELAVGEVARASAGLGGVPLPVGVGGKTPHDLRLRPPFRLPQPAVADPTPGRLLLDRPVAKAAQGPMTEVGGEAPPGILAPANATQETCGCRVGAKAGVGLQIAPAPSAQPQALRFQPGYVERQVHFFLPGNPGSPRKGGAWPGRPGRPGSFGNGPLPPRPGMPLAACGKPFGSCSLSSFGKLSRAFGSRRASSACIFSSSVALGPAPRPMPIMRLNMPPLLPSVFIMSAIWRCILSRR